MVINEDEDTLLDSIFNIGKRFSFFWENNTMIFKIIKIISFSKHLNFFPCNYTKENPESLMRSVAALSPDEEDNQVKKEFYLFS